MNTLNIKGAKCQNEREAHNIIMAKNHKQYFVPFSIKKLIVTIARVILKKIITQSSKI